MGVFNDPKLYTEQKKKIITLICKGKLKDVYFKKHRSYKYIVYVFNGYEVKNIKASLLNIPSYEKEIEKELSSSNRNQEYLNKLLEAKQNYQDYENIYR